MKGPGNVDGHLTACAPTESSASGGLVHSPGSTTEPSKPSSVPSTSLAADGGDGTAAVGDFDNDGRLDRYISRGSIGKTSLLRNMGQVNSRT